MFSTGEKFLPIAIHKWTFVGTDYTADETQARHVIFSNVIYITLPLVYTIFIIIDYKGLLELENFFKFDRIVFFAIVSLCILCLQLNKKGLVTTSRVLFLISWIVLLHIVPIIIHNSPSDYYVAYPLGIIFHSLLIHLCFSVKNEKWKFWPFLILNALLMITAPTFLIAFDLTPENTNALRTDPYFFLDIILYWLLVNLVASYFLFVFENYISRLTEANRLIKQQQAEMELKNEELQAAFEAVRNTNAKIEDPNRNLEEKVTLRTHELQEKNEKLVQYAFINAHLLRGPLCRLKGLANLRQLIPVDDPDHKRIDEMTKESISELDKITAEIQQLVEVNERRN